MRIFRYALCFLFYGHDKEKIIQDNLESRESLIECDRCGHLRTERMWFERWWRLISHEERREYLDVYYYNPFAVDDLIALNTSKETDECAVPPAGWRCTREAGHEGPCAAIRK